MISPFIFVEQIDSVQIIHLNRPEKLNALSREMIRDLIDLFTNLNSQPGVRAIILTGAGDKAFCTGTDQAELAGPDHHRALEISEREQALCNQIENCSVPVIAAVNGLATGAGCELALACHLRIASDNAQFSLTERKLDGRRQRLAREVVEESALEIMLSGKTVSAAEALHFGLVNDVVAGAELASQAKRLAREIAQLAPLAIRACLEAVTQGTKLSLAEGLALESKLFAGLFITDDVREGTNAFLEKRAPLFRGK
ncbi:MAG TPA: enoyl-CoA hydratase/isomerase family protein [Pyrinomonadaceae bacterium]|jgi:enoyl-CoA hydratase|nr:enoyl-CoA hydratase/isomerase family protein [Pyrinomonadaceae bacterium]